MPRLAPVTNAVRLGIKLYIMAYADLREFIRALDKHGELKRIPFEVDPELEITEFADRSVKNGGPALLFENPKGSKVPVRISEFLQMRMPEGIIGKLKMLPMLAEVGAFFPKIVNDGPCKEVIRKKDFSLD